MLFLLHTAEGGISVVKFLKKVVALFLLLATKGSSEIAAPITKNPFHSNGRKLEDCQQGFTWSTCAGCCGYKFSDNKTALVIAVAGYPANNSTYGGMRCWDVSNVTDMSGLFADNPYYDPPSTFDEPIGCWDVSSVTTMHAMFAWATKFNQDISKWNVSKVTNMYGMFGGALNFNSTIANWDVSKVLDMTWMLASSIFNQAIGNWDVSKVQSMHHMFDSAWKFNQDISRWNVSKVSGMYAMFKSATSFNQNIGNWNLSKNVYDMRYMFQQATNFNQDLCAWYNKLQSTPIVDDMFLSSGCTNLTSPNFSSKTSFCKACTSSNGGVQGDPHFKTWHGDHFSYHGECDLVLLKNEHFSDGLGILVHVRTKIEKTWSYVKSAAVKIGHDILEIEGKGQVWDKSADAVHSINGEVNAELPFQFAMKFPVTRLKEKQCDTNGAKCIEAIVYKIDLGEGNNILITQKWGVIKVSVTANDKKKFHDTVGLMGHFNKPGFLARDGIHKMTDFNQFGQEWQVLQSEPMIFNERRAPQHPEQCTLPTVTTKRRLGEDSAIRQLAEKACSGVEEASKEFCIFDVVAAETEEAASTYYTAYVG